MSLNRYAPKRDANEPAIRERFAHHGWHTEQRSSAGGWDLDAYAPFGVKGNIPLLARVVTHVDVKMPNGKVTKPQAKKWAELHAKGIPVYVVRTEADVDALVRGELAAWEPREKTTPVRMGRYGRAYTPPRSTPVNASKEAEETFAPGPPTCRKCGCQIRAMDGGVCNTCLEDVRFMQSKKEAAFAPCACTREQPCATHSVLP